MAELLLELYSEEIPPSLQISARNQLKFLIENSLKENEIKFKDLQVYSSPTRLTLFVKGLPDKTKFWRVLSRQRTLQRGTYLKRILKKENFISLK